MSWFPILLGAHISLAVALLLPSVLLPFVLRHGGGDPTPLTRLLTAMQGSGTLVVGAGLAVTGVAMLAALGPALLAQPWLLVALSLYGLNLAIAAFISRPNLRRLLRLSGGEGTAEEAWRRHARRQRLVAYAMAGLIGVIGLLMSAKPALW